MRKRIANEHFIDGSRHWTGFLNECKDSANLICHVSGVIEVKPNATIAASAELTIDYQGDFACGTWRDYVDCPDPDAWPFWSDFSEDTVDLAGVDTSAKKVFHNGGPNTVP